MKNSLIQGVSADRKMNVVLAKIKASGTSRSRTPPGSYGFTCWYCEKMLDTPFDDSKSAERFAQAAGWRLTLGYSKRWGDGANVTCPDCLPIGGRPEGYHFNWCLMKINFPDHPIGPWKKTPRWMWWCREKRLHWRWTVDWRGCVCTHEWEYR